MITFLIISTYRKAIVALITIPGSEHVFLGHVNAGRERDGHVVPYMTAEYMTLGEPDGLKKARLVGAKDMFRQAGFPV